MSPEKKAIYEELFASFDRVSEIMAGVGGLRHRPMIGGAFGAGRFSMFSLSLCLNGLHAAHYFVMEVESKAVISFGETKEKALRIAREMVESCDPLTLAMYFGRRKAAVERAAAEYRRKAQEEISARAAESRQRHTTVKSISRRRKRIFDESEGKCHYCATALTLDGKWHIEHKMPRALGGGDEPGNLVASCVPCNHEKRDTTDVEFKAKRAKNATNGRTA